MDVDSDHQVLNQRIIVPARLLSNGDRFETNEHSWFAISQIPTDLSIIVGDITFHVHKFPLVAKCGYLTQIDQQQQQQKLDSQGDINLKNFPGGQETFQIILKFCYGLQINLNPQNVVSLRCASEYLEMNEAQEDGNLISKTESFFTFVVLTSWKDTITVLNSCPPLYPWSENLQIVRRCCDSIAWKISRENNNPSEENQWLEDVANLSIAHYTRIVTCIREKGAQQEMIGSCITKYAEKWLPGIDEEKDSIGEGHMEWNVKSGDNREGVISKQTKEHRMIIESLVSMLLPLQKEVVSCKFLLRMLKMGIVYSVSPAIVSELEKRVGRILEQACVDDLLIPNYPIQNQEQHINLIEEHTMLNIEVVQRILEYFLMYQQQKKSISNVSKLLDSYLAEIAKDPNLTVTKFKVLAESLPETSRTCDDGLYRAIDMFLKSHPALPDLESRRLCKIMKCNKLSLDARIHAAQNDRLPMRTTIQVLFSEQVKLRSEMLGNDQKISDENSGHENSNWSKEEVKTLKTEIDMIKAKMEGLQKNYFDLQQEYRKLYNKHTTLSGWTFAWLKNKRLSFHQGMMNNKQDTSKGQQRSSSDQKTRISRRKSMS